MADSIDYEQLDLFYLGREQDPLTGKETTFPLLLKSKHLTTHAAIIGMTGSGKTGLGIALLEEAAIDKVPAIVIDPKGDMGNLLLSFPELAPADFLPWVDPLAAEQENISVEQLAERTAATWSQGLADWGQDRDRILRMRENADFVVYTPGSGKGRSISIVDSLEAPPADVLADTETLVSLLNATLASLLGLLGIEVDPFKSREHILLSTIVLFYWQQGQGLTLETLISCAMQPPFKQVGVFPLESFYPQVKRMELAMQLNTLIASPAYSSWTLGEPLRIENLLYSWTGKPRISIFSIAHLNDAERMSFVTLLLGRLISWMRRQEGSSGLRCLLYMDEIFGFFPPVVNPPSKRPMLLLLKQARAYGLGVVLSTQNPVDLDYKGLANIGTWFVGRLQTRQDQDRVLAGLSATATRFDPQEARRMIAGLPKRTFLLYSVHRQQPELFTTRWVLSYLKGPLSLAEIGELEQRGEQRPVAEPQYDTLPLPAAEGAPLSTVQPLLADSIAQYFIPPPLPTESIAYHPVLFGIASVRMFNSRRGIDQVEQLCLRLPLPQDYLGVDWRKADESTVILDDLLNTPPSGSSFAELPAALKVRTDLKAEQKSLGEYLYRTRTLSLLRVKALGLESVPGESENVFRQRMVDLLTRQKDQVTAKIEEEYLIKQCRLETRLQKAYARIGKEEGEVKEKGVDAAISFGVAILGALLGRKPFSVSTATRSARGVRSVGRLLKEKEDVQRAREEVAQIEQEIARLGEALRQKIREQVNQLDPDRFAVERFTLAPRRTDIFNIKVGLLWEPQYDFSSFAGSRGNN
jgi:hypothetical protein